MADPDRRGAACRALAPIPAFGPPAPGTLSTIVRSFKSAATKAINQNRGTPGQPVWQPNFHQHIVGNEEDVNGIRRHILDNPAQWELDEYNLPGNSGK